MGHMHASDYASGEHCDLDTGLLLHLQGNHFPPVSASFMPACKEAMSFILDGNAGHEITMPNGKTVTADEIMEGLHLQPFVQAAFFAQENPCDNCEEVWGSLYCDDCGQCPQYWKNEAKEPGYYGQAEIHESWQDKPKEPKCYGSTTHYVYAHLEDATSLEEAMATLKSHVAERFGEEVIERANLRVRKTGDPYWTLEDMETREEA